MRCLSGTIYNVMIVSTGGNCDNCGALVRNFLCIEEVEKVKSQI